MIISQIVAVGENGVIGCNNQLPWFVPEDLKHFKTITMHKTLIMGRLTYQSLPKVLEGRRIIVLSKRFSKIKGAEVAANMDDALSLCHGESEIIVAGGELIYRATLSLTKRIYLTHIHLSPEGDAFYPLKDLKDFELISSRASDHPEVLKYCIYERR